MDKLPALSRLFTALCVLVFMLPLTVIRWNGDHGQVGSGIVVDMNAHNVQPSFNEKSRSAPNVASPKEVTKVLLMTYHRSGSTFLGEMMNQNPSVFYMFEPLLTPFNHWIHQTRSHSLDRLYVHKNGSLFKLPEGAEQDLVNPLIDILNCDFSKVNWPILSHYFHTRLKYSNSLGSYRACFRSHGGSPEVRVRKCLNVIEKSCKSKPIRSVKTIRLSGQLTTMLLAKQPDTKVVYYIRDPRGMIVSKGKARREVVNIRSVAVVRNASRALCNRIRQDMRAIQRLGNNSQVLLLKYEELALNPRTAVVKLYNHIGAAVPSSVRKWISSSTQSRKPDGVMGTQRNSRKVALKWKSSIPHIAEVEIIKSCRDVMLHFGYTL